MEPNVEQKRMRRELGHRLVQVRGRLTQEAYAAQLGVHVNTLARYERGERWPGADLLQLLAADGVDLHWLLTGHAGGGVNGVGSSPDGGDAHSGLSELNGTQEQIAESRADYICSGISDGHGELGAGLNEGPEPNLPSKRLSKRPGKQWGDPVAVPDPDERAEVRAGPAALFFDEGWLRTRWSLGYDQAYLVQVQGDSMEPTLKAGDQVLVDRREDHVPQDGLYLLRLGHSLIVRRLQRLPQGRCRVLSANPAYASFTIDIRTRKRECHVLGRVLWVGQSV